MAAESQLGEMTTIDRIASEPRARQALESIDRRSEEFLDWIVAVQQIPAPTFAEAERATYIQSRFGVHGLSEVWQDSLHNVFGKLAGSNPGQHPPVIISAHSDTVFPAHTNLSIRREEHYLYGPGVGDNAAGVGGLLALADVLHANRLQPAADVWFVSNVGEEGMGDLRGMRAVVERFGKSAVYIVVEGGHFGHVAHEAIGVKRFRIEVTTPGGHSWGSFGTPNAIHELGRIIARIDQVRVSGQPKSTYNIGVVEGGTSVNTIAPSAGMLLDLRSESAVELERLVHEVTQIIYRAQKRARRNQRSINVEIRQVGNRPAGQIPRSTPLVGWAEDALRYVGCDAVRFVAGSTDANIPLSLGIPCVCIGLTESANSHRLDEYIEVNSVPNGLKQLLLLALAAGHYRALE